MNNTHSFSLPLLNKHKVVFLGDSGVGKTSIIQRIIFGSYDDRKQETVAIDFLKKDLIHEKQMHRLMLWDTAGQEKYDSLISLYTRQADCAIITYDVSQQKGLRSCHKWIQFIGKMERQCSIILLGNKCDTDKKIRKDQIRKQFDLTKIDSFLEVSAKSGQGFEKLMKAIVRNCQNIKRSESTKDTQQSQIKKGVEIRGPPQQLKFKPSNTCCSI